MIEKNNSASSDIICTWDMRDFQNLYLNGNLKLVEEADPGKSGYPTKVAILIRGLTINYNMNRAPLARLFLLSLFVSRSEPL